ELRLDRQRLYQLQLEEARDEVARHFDAGIQVLEGPDDALQVARRLAVLREERLAILDADARVIEIDRDLGAVRVEGDALQTQGPVELQVAPLLEKEVLPLIEP